MRRHPLTLAITLAASILAPAVARMATAAGPPFELTVKRDHLLGHSQGTLVVDADGLEYRTTDKDDARRWAYDDVKQLQVLSPTRIAVLSYEDGGKLKLGSDRTFDFTLIGGSSLSAEFVTFLLDRVQQPVVTAVMPQYGGKPLFRLRVKHQRQGRGSEGTLALFDKQLVYFTEREGDGRYWRLADIFSVQVLDRSRLEVTVYEGGGGTTRPFVFELKTGLPVGFFDALWARVNPAGLDLAQRPRENDLAHAVDR